MAKTISVDDFLEASKRYTSTDIDYTDLYEVGVRAGTEQIIKEVMMFPSANSTVSIQDFSDDEIASELRRRFSGRDLTAFLPPDR